ncbi:MAG TPA: lipoprotein [Undibacterium sp.]|nr:lipoprotein [Undibacterium sp.]
MKTHTRFPAAVALCLALGSLTACGQKGPLYLPKKPAGIATGNPAPATSAPSGAPADASAPVKQAPPVEGSGN